MHEIAKELLRINEIELDKVINNSNTSFNSLYFDIFKTNYKNGELNNDFLKKPIINNNINNNYCAREKSHIDQCFRCNRKESSGFKVSSDEGLSLAPTTSGLSSGKDDDCGAEEGGNPQPLAYGVFSNSSNSSTNSWCFIDENNRKELALPVPEQAARTMSMPTN